MIKGAGSQVRPQNLAGMMWLFMLLPGTELVDDPRLRKSTLREVIAISQKTTYPVQDPIGTARVATFHHGGPKGHLAPTTTTA